MYTYEPVPKLPGSGNGTAEVVDFNPIITAALVPAHEGLLLVTTRNLYGVPVSEESPNSNVSICLWEWHDSVTVLYVPTNTMIQY